MGISFFSARHLKLDIFFYFVFIQFSVSVLYTESYFVSSGLGIMKMMLLFGGRLDMRLGGNRILKTGLFALLYIPENLYT